MQKDNYVAEDFKIRKLTPIECERLQTVPDNYTNVIDCSAYFLYNNKEANTTGVSLCNVKSMGAREKRQQKNMVNYVLCTTKELLDTDQLIYQKLISKERINANIAIEKLEKRAAGQGACVIDITKTGLDMETLYTLIKTKKNSGREDIKSELVIRSYTGKLLRITSEESCQEVRLFTMLIAIKLITELKICTYVTDRANIRYCIGNLKESQGNLSGVVLSCLEMGNYKAKLLATLNAIKCSEMDGRFL